MKNNGCRRDTESTLPFSITNLLCQMNAKRLESADEQPQNFSVTEPTLVNTPGLTPATSFHNRSTTAAKGSTPPACTSSPSTASTGVCANLSRPSNAAAEVGNSHAAPAAVSSVVMTLPNGLPVSWGGAAPHPNPMMVRLESHTFLRGMLSPPMEDDAPLHQHSASHPPPHHQGSSHIQFSESFRNAGPRNPVPAHREHAAGSPQIEMTPPTAGLAPAHPALSSPEPQRGAMMHTSRPQAWALTSPMNSGFSSQPSLAGSPSLTSTVHVSSSYTDGSPKSHALIVPAMSGSLFSPPSDASRSQGLETGPNHVYLASPKAGTGTATSALDDVEDALRNATAASLILRRPRITPATFDTAAVAAGQPSNRNISGGGPSRSSLFRLYLGSVADVQSVIKKCEAPPFSIQDPIELLPAKVAANATAVELRLATPWRLGYPVASRPPSTVDSAAKPPPQLIASATPSSSRTSSSAGGDASSSQAPMSVDRMCPPSDGSPVTLDSPSWHTTSDALGTPCAAASSAPPNASFPRTSSLPVCASALSDPRPFAPSLPGVSMTYRPLVQLQRLSRETGTPAPVLLRAFSDGSLPAQRAAGRAVGGSASAATVVANRMRAELPYSVAPADPLIGDTRSVSAPKPPPSEPGQPLWWFLCCARELDAPTPTFGHSKNPALRRTLQEGRFHRLEMPDGPEADLPGMLPKALAFLAEAERSGGNVVVYCQKGISRSPTVVAAFLMIADRLASDTAMDHLRRRRPIVNPNVHFLLQLRAFEHSDAHETALRLAAAASGAVSKQ